jgi:hypothetical protein
MRVHLDLFLDVFTKHRGRRVVSYYPVTRNVLMLIVRTITVSINAAVEIISSKVSKEIY